MADHVQHPSAVSPPAARRPQSGVVRVLVVGEYRADRFVAALARRTAVEAVLGGPTDVSADVGPGCGYRYLPADAGHQELAVLLEDERPDLVAPCLYPLGQEQMLPALARACGPRQGLRRGWVVHPDTFARLSTDKVLFQRTAERRGWPVPPGVVCGDQAQLATEVGRHGQPMMVKAARAQSGQGRWYLPDPDALPALPGAVFPLLVQQVCQGEEFGLELFTLDGHTVCWPVASFGRLDAQCRPGWRARTMPARLPDSAAAALDRFIEDVVTSFSPCGPWQIDFAVAEGKLAVLEINGRFSGMADLSRAATGTDPYDVFAAACLDAPLPVPAALGVAMELPVRHGASLPPAPAGIRVRPQPPVATNRALPNHFRRTLAFAQEAAVLHSWLSQWPDNGLLAPLNDALVPLEQLLAAALAPDPQPADDRRGRRL
ncbi:hypothetical protein [Streptomyces sp. NPDC048340]|uniref:hypothetical protein n=1 Tax=Streptomyces sp. NPDC048340 TaxID=3365537 RepID=UPI003712DA51